MAANLLMLQILRWRLWKDRNQIGLDRSCVGECRGADLFFLSEQALLHWMGVLLTEPERPVFELMLLPMMVVLHAGEHN